MDQSVSKRPLWKSVLRIVLWLILALVVLFAVQAFRYRDTIQRVMLGGVKVYETTAPPLPAEIKRPAILVFSKTNGFRHEEAIPAAARLFDQMAADNGWGVYQTENGAVFTPQNLARFDAVVFSNTSGDVFTPDQRAAFKAFIESGGGYVGIHAAGDNSHAAWDWYVKTMIGTNFVGHPMRPQFQRALVRIENVQHPATEGLAGEWPRVDEWYSFDKSPRSPGITVLATLDEKTYNQQSLMGSSLAMGADHPIIWAHCVGKGRVFYSALGHTAESYAEPEYQHVLHGAILWAMRRGGTGCDN